jgi:hypothetical protein
MSALPPKADISWRQSNVCWISAALVVGNVGKHVWVLSFLPDVVLVAPAVEEFAVETERKNVVG